MKSQPKFETPFNDLLTYTGYGLITFGTTCVVTSFLRLGWFGTWHGKRINGDNIGPLVVDNHRSYFLYSGVRVESFSNPGYSIFFRLNV